MSNDVEDTGMIEALLQRLNDFRLPRLLELQERVDRGETMSDSDIEFLEGALEDAHHAAPLADRHKELHPLAAKMSALYHEITSKALENETKNKN